MDIQALDYGWLDCLNKPGAAPRLYLPKQNNNNQQYAKKELMTSCGMVTNKIER
jgi:hypothetical protein